MSDEAEDFDKKALEKRMQGALNVLKQEFSGMRTGRASASLLEPISVNAYGTRMPINQVATISVPEPRMLSVQVWDKSNVSAVDKAIRESDLGLNPIVDGTSLRLPIPEMNEERRNDLAKVCAKYAEQARVAVRNVRRDGMDQLKKQEKEGIISEDEHHALAEDVQALTNKYIGEIDAALAEKEKEIMQV